MKLIIVSGISGVGKSTLVKQFIKEGKGKYELVRSMTTRSPRNSDDYYTYISKMEFVRLLEQGAFLETNLYQGSKELYGTPKREIERIVTEGKTPILEIDVHGKRQIECTMEQHGFVPISIFITAPAGIVAGTGSSTRADVGRYKDDLLGLIENIKAKGAKQID